MTWFPCMLQMYVWFVMFTMKCKCFIPFCAKYLSVAVPLPDQHEKAVAFNKQNSVKVLKRSSRKNISQHSFQLSDDNISINENDRTPIVAGRQLSRQTSSKFAVPGTPVIGSNSSDAIVKNKAMGPRHSGAPSQLVRQITRKLDKENKDGFEAETHFGDCTNLYFIVMRRGLGIILLLIVLILTIVFAYTATLITVPTETTDLLPESTNWGRVSAALDNMDIDTASYSGYSPSTGESTGVTVIAPKPATPKPTRNPTYPTAAPVPTAPVQPTENPTNVPTSPTNNPTPKPTGQPTPAPTDAPITPGTPTQAPTDPTETPTKSPSAQPTAAPVSTAQPSLSPSKAPTDPPTTAQPTNSPSKTPTNNPTPATSSPTKAPSDQPTTSNPTTFAPTEVGATPNPTTQPTDPTESPTTDNPTTASPTTASPTTAAPTTAQPTGQPTTAQPTTLEPTDMPTTTQPTNAPTMRPTYDQPESSVFSCTNQVANVIYELEEGESFTCNAELYDDLGITTKLEVDKIAVVFEGGWSGITGCNTRDDESPYYSEYAYNSTYNTRWCFIDKIEWDNYENNATNTSEFSFIAPYSTSSQAWIRISLWLYYDNKWNVVPNTDETEPDPNWYNYSVLDTYSSLNEETLSVEESITVYLVFGTQTVSDYTTDCDGDVTSGEIQFDEDFNLYSNGAQWRWINLCDKLANITDNVMYRDDEDQEPCFAEEFKNYITYLDQQNVNDSNYQQLGWPISTANTRYTFNTYLVDWLQNTKAIDENNDLVSYDSPSYFDSWIGFDSNEYTVSKTNWSNENATISWIVQECKTQISNKWGGAAMYEYYEKWQDFINDFNKASPNEFKGIQTSVNYIRMEVELAFLDGFVKSVLYTLILCACVMIFFTQNFFLVVLVCLYILIICIWVVGLFGAVGWPFGIIEIISVPTVIGLTIDYALHITHAYIHSPFPDRKGRAKSAVNDLGSSVFASAMTTISSMLILYFATIVIFSDLGWVVGSTTAFGVALALFVCPPLLMYAGPQRDVGHVTWCFRCKGITLFGIVWCSNEWHGTPQKKMVKKEIEQKQELELAVKDGDEINDIEQMFDDQQEGTGGAAIYEPGSPKQSVASQVDAIQIPQPSAQTGTIQSEPNNVDDLGGDLPPSYQDEANRNLNIVKVEPVQFAKHVSEQEVEANSEEEDNGDDNNESYILPPANTNNGGETKKSDAETPLVSADNEYDKILNEQALILENIQKEQQENKIDDDDDNDNDIGYAPPAPAPPSSQDEIIQNQEKMKQQIMTPGDATDLNADNNDNDNDNEYAAPPAPAPPSSQEEIIENEQKMKQQMITAGITDLNEDNDDNDDNDVNNAEVADADNAENEIEIELSVSLEYDPSDQNI